ncbi:MAG: hypothetical protein BWZ10_03385 [candidate division BRC1 bacterium ADurb.BinA364]|nr:MAG: hypothetical protein BWZ10_03385 [candidate division BRC1 bacterium ADurb.BinA364]
MNKVWICESVAVVGRLYESAAEFQARKAHGSVRARLPCRGLFDAFGHAANFGLQRFLLTPQRQQVGVCSLALEVAGGKLPERLLDMALLR